MLSDKIRKYRKENNMSQDELAEKLNVSRQSVSLWENGQTQPTIDNIIALAKIFGVPASELLGDELGETNMEKKSKHKNMFIIIGVIIVLLLVVLLITLGNKDTNKVDPTNDQTSKVLDENFDLFDYCKNFAIENGVIQGDIAMYKRPSNLYGGYENENFSIAYWGDSDMVEFCLHCPLDETYSIAFYLQMRGGFDGTYEYTTSYYYRSNGENIRYANGYINPSEFSDNYPLNCDKYIGDSEMQNSFMEESRVGMCDLIKCLKEFVVVENMECGFDAFGFVKF